MYEESIRYYVRALAMNPKADNAWQYLRISLRYVMKQRLFLFWGIKTKAFSVLWTAMQFIVWLCYFHLLQLCFERWHDRSLWFSESWHSPKRVPAIIYALFWAYVVMSWVRVHWHDTFILRESWIITMTTTTIMTIIIISRRRRRTMKEWRESKFKYCLCHGIKGLPG